VKRCDAADQLTKRELDLIPAIGFDLSGQMDRSLFQLFTELAA
jgi:hypothetical protein